MIMPKKDDAITAVVMAGGKGTRLHPITSSIPKALVPVREKPILDYLLSRLHQCGVRRVVMAINHLAEIIMAVVGDGSRWGLEVSYSLEDKPLGTIGPLHIIENLPENFLVMNADLLTDLDMKELYDYHISGDSLLTISTIKRKHEVDFGVIHYSEETKNLTGFEEKPVLEYAVSTGIYAMNRNILNFIPKGKPFGLDSLVESLLSAKENIKIYEHSGEWLDIGRLEDFIEANKGDLNFINKISGTDSNPSG